jgi:GT2 family glycosyltransferase
VHRVPYPRRDLRETARFDAYAPGPGSLATGPWRYARGLTPLKPEKEKQPPRVSVVVVSHNRVDLLRACLESIERSEGRATLQVILVENGSSDGSERLDSEFPNVQFIRLPKNFGLTKALNLGWRAADAEYVLFLHDDTRVEPGTVLRLAEAMDTHPEAAAVCPMLVDDSGQPAPQFGTLPPTGEWRPAATPAPDGATAAGPPSPGEPVAVEYARGAALMVRVFFIRALRQIDERYGQFGSDADLAAEIRRASRKVLLMPSERVWHHGPSSYSALERADFLLGRAVFLGKYHGFGAGLRARLASVFGPLTGLRLGELRNTLAGQKIDGTQT